MSTQEKVFSQTPSFQLTAEQKEIIKLIPNNNIRIIACAGAGKTEVVARGTGEIIKQGTDPANVVAFTYTEKAAGELKARIREVLLRENPERSDISEMYVGTIHSFCFEILKDLVPKYKSYDVLDEAKRVAFLSKPANYYQNLKLNKLEAFGKSRVLAKYSVINRFISCVDLVLNESIPIRKINVELRNSIEAYLDLLEQERYLDFSTMISTLVGILSEKKDVRKKLQARIKNLIVDEYQDINGLQQELIKNIIGAETKICVVGDDDQCIYNWRGSIVGYIIKFHEQFENVKKRTLRCNFRSTGKVIGLANSLIAKNSFRLEKAMFPAKSLKAVSAKDDIQYFHFKKEKEQVGFIKQRIKELLGTDFPGKNGKKYSLSLADMAILIRSNDDIARIIGFLDEAKIKYVVDNGKYIFETEIVDLAIKCIDYIFDADEIQLDQITMAYEALFNKGEYTINKGFKSGLRQLHAEMLRIAEISPKDYLPELGLQGVYHKILFYMGLQKADLDEADHFYLSTLSQAISDYESVWRRLRYSEIKYFKGFILAWGQSHYREFMSSDAINIDAIKIMTIHKAKGLEFPVVFIPYLNQKQKRRNVLSFVDEGLYASARYHGDVEDERRIYYVALTRSERYLFMSGMEDDPSVKNLRRPLELLSDFDGQFISKPSELTREKNGCPPRLQRDDALLTSFSELSSFGRCPYDYKLRHYYGYNAGAPVTFGFGTRIHDILNIIHKENKNSPPEDSKIDDLIENNFFLRYAPGGIVENAQKAAKKIIKNYVKGHADDFRKILETEKKFEFMLTEDSIAGQIDLIKKIDEKGNVNEIEVVDFKSDSSLLYKKDYEHQLRLYVLACISALKLKPLKACIHDLEKGAKNYIDIAPEKLEETKAALTKRIVSIKNKGFTAKSDPKICSECDYDLICFNCKKN